MKIDHVAIWAEDIETLREYYMKYLDASSNEMYVNRESGFRSYFLSFGSGAKVEIMHRSDIPANTNDTIGSQHRGIIHLSFLVETMEEVDAKARLLEAGGYKVLRGPRVTGDGYYEFETADPEGNRLEVMSVI